MQIKTQNKKWEEEEQKLLNKQKKYRGNNKNKWLIQ